MCSPRSVETLPLFSGAPTSVGNSESFKTLSVSGNSVSWKLRVCENTPCVAENSHLSGGHLGHIPESSHLMESSESVEALPMSHKLPNQWGGKSLWRPCRSPRELHFSGSSEAVEALPVSHEAPTVGSSESIVTLPVSQRAFTSVWSLEYLEMLPESPQGALTSEGAQSLWRHHPCPTSVGSSESLKILSVSQRAPLHGGSESVEQLRVPGIPHFCGKLTVCGHPARIPGSSHLMGSSESVETPLMSQGALTTR